MPPEKPKSTKLKVTSGIVVTLAVVMLVIASTVTKAQDSKQTTVATTVNSTPTSSSTTSSATSTNSVNNESATSLVTSYKDGTYTASSSYYVPHGSEQIEVSLTIENGVVTDSSIQNSEGDRESIQYQEDFSSEYKSSVVGKNISEINLSRVAGASDTTDGFNDALAKIKTEATS